MKTKRQKQEEALARQQYAYQAGFNYNPKATSLRHIGDLRRKLGMEKYRPEAE